MLAHDLPTRLGQRCETRGAEDLRQSVHRSEDLINCMSGDHSISDGVRHIFVVCLYLDDIDDYVPTLFSETNQIGLLI